MVINPLKAIANRLTAMELAVVLSFIKSGGASFLLGLFIFQCFGIFAMSARPSILQKLAGLGLSIILLTPFTFLPIAAIALIPFSIRETRKRCVGPSKSDFLQVYFFTLAILSMISLFTFALILIVSSA